jgi:predicted peptidase
MNLLKLLQSVVFSNLFIAALCFISNAVSAQALSAPDTVTWFDSVRQRRIPIAFYKPKVKKSHKKYPLIIFSHGYGQNVGGDYLIYSYLNGNLARNGYFVASIQHELPTDDLIPMEGIPRIVRRPFWERGVENIRFVIDELTRRGYDLDFRHITLVGHSNGGDMTALFPEKYPGKVYRIITLDNRRMALPLKEHVFSLRSSDQPADEGVLPSSQSLLKYKMTVIKLSSTKHNEMDDDAKKEQRKEINTYLNEFLKR